MVIKVNPLGEEKPIIFLVDVLSSKKRILDSFKEPDLYKDYYRYIDSKLFTSSVSKRVNRFKLREVVRIEENIRIVFTQMNTQFKILEIKERKETNQLEIQE